MGFGPEEQAWRYILVDLFRNALPSKKLTFVLQQHCKNLLQEFRRRLLSINILNVSK